MTQEKRMTGLVGSSGMRPFCWIENQTKYYDNNEYNQKLPKLTISPGNAAPLIQMKWGILMPLGASGCVTALGVRLKALL